MPEECIFCKIVNKEIPNYTVYEDGFVLAFLDIFPHAKGHTVVIPKKHFNTYLELNDEDARLMLQGVKEALERVNFVLKPDGFNVGWNERPAGGQVVPHLHFHIFPRYDKDQGGSMHSIINNPGDLSVQEVYNSFRTSKGEESFEA